VGQIARALHVSGSMLRHHPLSVQHSVAKLKGEKNLSLHMLLRLNPTDCTTICKLCSPYITNTRCAVLCSAVLYSRAGLGWAGQELMVVR
jgi:hypothetical protein